MSHRSRRAAGVLATVLVLAVTLAAGLAACGGSTGGSSGGSSGGGGTSRWMIAPLGIWPAVGTPCDKVCAWPATSKPVTETAPCASA